MDVSSIIHCSFMDRSCEGSMESSQLQGWKILCLSQRNLGIGLLVCLSVSLFVCLSVGLSVKICYEPALSSKQDLFSMRGVDISPEHKETNKNNSKGVPQTSDSLTGNWFLSNHILWAHVETDSSNMRITLQNKYDYRN